MVTATAAEQIEFLGNIQRLIDEGAFVASYKYALLMLLADFAVERTADPDGTLKIPLSDIAERFLELYWRQATPFRGKALLAQNTGRQAAIITRLVTFREHARTLSVARHHARWQRLVVSTKNLLEKMPLWRLQTVGNEKLVFLYEERLEDGAIRLKPGVAAGFRALFNVIQALIQLAWLRYVQSLPSNRELLGHGADLADFLFGAERNVLSRLGARLHDFQGGKCFYCRRPIRGIRAEVDHFIPWARYPRDLGHNFVLADHICNASKSDFLADVTHLETWRQRNTGQGSELAGLFKDAGIFSDLDTSVQVAAWCYEATERAGGQVWVGPKELRTLGANWRACLL